MLNICKEYNFDIGELELIKVCDHRLKTLQINNINTIIKIEDNAIYFKNLDYGTIMYDDGIPCRRVKNNDINKLTFVIPKDGMLQIHEPANFYF